MLIFTVQLADLLLPFLVTVAVIVAEPAPFAVTFPPETVAPRVLEDFQETVPPFVLAVKVKVEPPVEPLLSEMVGAADATYNFLEELHPEK